MNAPIPVRLPPHSIEAEQSLIGGLLLDNAVWDRIADVVTEGDFYRDDHRRIIGHIRGLLENSKPADVVTVFESIRRSNEVDLTGGQAYLGEIANATPSAANARQYAEIVANTAKLRALILMAGEIENAAYSATHSSTAAMIDNATARLMQLAASTAGHSDPLPIGSVLGTVVDEIQRRYDGDGAVSGVPTGFADLDEALDGLKPGDLVIVAGRPSMGKTAFALNIAENVALAGKPVMMFSLEMADTQLAQRSLASIGRINNKALASGRLSDDGWDRLTAALGKLHEAPLWIDQRPNSTVSQMLARCRRVMHRLKKPLGLVVIDYLQLMSADGNNRNEELGAITRALKLMARELDCPVVCLSQLSRKVEERTDKRPILSDLRESGAIEQDADVVLMMYRDEYYHDASQCRRLAEVLIRKNRMGECRTVALSFSPEFSRFDNADSEAVARSVSAVASARPRRNKGFSG